MNLQFSGNHKFHFYDGHRCARTLLDRTVLVRTESLQIEQLIKLHTVVLQPGDIVHLQPKPAHRFFFADDEVKAIKT